MRGKAKILIERKQDFLGSTPLDSNIFTATGTATYNGLDLCLEGNPCGIATCPFDMNKITIAEFSLGNIYTVADAILSLSLATENGLYGITVTSADCNSNANALVETKCKTRMNGADSALSVLLPKHNISGQRNKYYCVSMRIDKNLNRLTILSNGQELGHKTLSAVLMNNLSESHFTASWTAETQEAASIQIGQLALKLWY